MRYIVINECMLGIIYPDVPLASILASFVTKGAVFTVHLDPRPIFSLDIIRDATNNDFDDYRIVKPKNHE